MDILDKIIIKIEKSITLKELKALDKELTKAKEEMAQKENQEEEEVSRLIKVWEKKYNSN